MDLVLFLIKIIFNRHFKINALGLLFNFIVSDSAS